MLGPAAGRRARSARARRAVAQAAHDGEVRKRFSNLTIVCGLAVGRAECVSYVYLCHVSSCPAGRGLPAACSTRSSESDKQPHASLLSQRPSHPTDRPDPGRPRPALLPLHAVVRARNGCCSLPRGCSAPHCWSCKCWTRASYPRRSRLAHCYFYCGCCGCLICLNACRCVVCCCGYCAVQFWSARNAQNLNFGWSTSF